MNPLDGMGTAEQRMCAVAAENKIPINGSLELLPLCNMNCDMCYVRLDRAQMERLGRLRTAEEWISLGREMQKEGVLFLLLTGGEPLLYPQFREVYAALKEMGFILTINTNATLIDEEWADFFRKYLPRRVNVTLYGKDEEAYEKLCHYPGGFARAVRGIRLLRERGIDVKISSSLTQINVDDWEQIIRIGEELDAPVRMDTYMYPADRERTQGNCLDCRLSPEDAATARVALLHREMGEEIFCRFVDQTLWYVENLSVEPDEARGVDCMAGRCSFTVNWQGRMRPCVVMTEPETDVFAHGFCDSWKRIVEQTSVLRLNPACSSCEYRQICHTCVACARCETGRDDGIPEYMCRYTRETVRRMREWKESQSETCEIS